MSFNAFLDRLRTALGGSSEGGRARWRMPAVEPLEDRVVPACTFNWHGLNGLYIYGTEAGDEAIVERTVLDGRNYVQVLHRSEGEADYQVAGRFGLESNLTAIHFYGYGGGDTFTNNTIVTSHVYGGSGDDSLTGGEGWDYLHGEEGSDTLYGMAELDRLYGGLDYDYLYGGDGDDFLDGGGTTQHPEVNFLDVVRGEDYVADQWAVEGATFDDVLQTGVDACGFYTNLAAISRNGGDLADRISYGGDDIYQVQLFEEGAPRWYTVYFDGYTLNGEIGRPADGDFWPLLYQRAYFQYLDDHEDPIEWAGHQLGKYGFSFVGTTTAALTGQSYNRHGLVEVIVANENAFPGRDLTALRDSLARNALIRIDRALREGRPVVGVTCCTAGTPTPSWGSNPTRSRGRI